MADSEDVVTLTLPTWDGPMGYQIFRSTSEGMFVTRVTYNEYGDEISVTSEMEIADQVESEVPQVDLGYMYRVVGNVFGGDR